MYLKTDIKLSLLIPKILIKRIGKNNDINTYIFIFILLKIKFTKKYKINPIAVSNIAVEYSIKPSNLGLKL